MNRIIKIDSENLEYEANWDEFVKSQPEGQIYFTTDYLKIIQQESAEELIRLLCINETNQVVGILPLVTTKGFPLGIGGLTGAKRLSSLPRTPIGGYLAIDENAKKMLLCQAIEMISERSDRFLQIKSYDTLLDEQIKSLTKYFWREIYITDIPPLTQELRFGNSKNHTTIKRAVNKAIKSGVTVRYTESENDLLAWYDLLVDTMRFHTIPVRSISFFNNLWVNLRPKGLMKLAVAEIESGGKKKIIAGSIFFFYNKTVTYAFGGSKREDFELRPNDLIHWNVIHDAQKNGFDIYDWGEVSKDNEGLAAYKKKWGSRKLFVYHYYYPKPKFVGNDDFDQSSPSGLMKKIWNLLPLKITTIIGEQIYKRL